MTHDFEGLAYAYRVTRRHTTRWLYFFGALLTLFTVSVLIRKYI